jgi:hypothetical protein
MKTLRIAIAFAVITMLVGLPIIAEGQQAYRLTEKEVKSLLGRIEKSAERFRNSLDRWLDVSHFQGSKAEDNINQFMKEFEAATDHLEDRFDNDQSANGDVEEVLRRAVRIDNFMVRNAQSSQAQAEWATLRGDLDELARAYNVVWTWDGGITPAYRLTDDQVRSLLTRIEADADRFRASLDDALDKTHYNKTSMEDDINSFIKEFERATDHLEDRFGKKQSASGDAEEVLRRAARIDAFMRQHTLTLRAQEDWQRLRAGLDELSAAYNVEWKWM